MADRGRIIQNPFGLASTTNAPPPVSSVQSTLSSPGSSGNQPPPPSSSSSGRYGAPPPPGSVPQAQTQPFIPNNQASSFQQTQQSTSFVPQSPLFQPTTPMTTNVPTPVQTQAMPVQGAQQGTRYGPPPQPGAPPPQQGEAPPPAGNSAPSDYTRKPLPMSMQQSAPQLSSEQRTERLPSPPSLIPNQNGEIVYYQTVSNPIPPPAASQFVTIDQGNCGPRYMRSTAYSIPTTADIAKQSNLPFGVVIQPLADPSPGEKPVPIVDFGPSGPLRCTRCRAYISSLDSFTSGGRNYICFLCQHVNSVPDEYFSPVGPDGYRLDVQNRPELHSGSVEFIASPDYIGNRAPQPLSFVFLIDVSQGASESGVLQTFAASAKAILNALPETCSYRFAFITYSDTIQFYHLNEQLSTPRVLSVGDIEDMFLPMNPEGNLIVNFQSSKSQINELLNRLPKMFENVGETQNCFGAAVRTAAMLLRHSGGKIIAFQSTMPNLAPGELNPSRMKVDWIGTDRERELYKPHGTYYEQFAHNCADLKIGFDLFLLARDYCDIATLSSITKITGGHLYYFPRYSVQRDRLHVHHELHRCITRTTGYDAVLKVRTSTGLEINDYYGDFRLVFGSEMEMGTIDCNKTIVCGMRHIEKIPDESFVGIQSVLLYTTSAGERRIRVHNLRLQTSSHLSKIFAGVDLEAIVYYFSCKAIRESMTASLHQIRRQLVDQCIDIVYAFRKYCSQKAYNPTILILPEGLKLYPLYILCLMKTSPLKIPRINVDFRLASRLNLSNMSVRELTLYLYPRMFALHKLPPSAGTENSLGTSVLPPWERLLSSNLEPSGCYLLDNGQRLVLWVGKEISTEFLQSVFGVNSVNEELTFANSDNPLLSRIKAVILAARSEHPCYKPFIVIKQGGDKEFVNLMVEDRVEETMSHSDILAFVHKEVSRKLGKSV